MDNSLIAEQRLSNNNNNVQSRYVLHTYTRPWKPGILFGGESRSEIIREIIGTDTQQAVYCKTGKWGRWKRVRVWSFFTLAVKNARCWGRFHRVVNALVCFCWAGLFNPFEAKLTTKIEYLFFTPALTSSTYFITPSFVPKPWAASSREV